MLIFPGMLFWGNPEHNAPKAWAVLRQEILIPRLLRIYLLTLYYRQASSLCCSLVFLKCYGFFWVWGFTFHLENKPRNKLLKKQEDGTKTIRKTRGIGSFASPITYKSAELVKIHLTAIILL